MRCKLGPRGANLGNVQIEIINTGSELLLGRVLNTHQRFLCRALAEAGYTVDRQTCVPDAPGAIRQAVAESLGRAEVVITTGGLGPTSDDRTRDVICELVGQELTVNDQVLERIQSWFARRQRQMPPSTALQAKVPASAHVLLNEHGTAPGLAMEIASGLFRPTGNVLLMLPGPPRELHPMFTHQALPWIRERFPPTGPFICRTLKTTGLGESRVEELIAPHLVNLVSSGLDIGYCARTGEVDVRFTAHGDSAEEMVARAEHMTRTLLGNYVFGVGDDQLEQIVISMLSQGKQSLVVAESCTGGFIANRLTNVPGASDVFWGGMVTYANEAKTRMLGVRGPTLAQHGAVSEPTAREMAEGARSASGCHYSIATTGIAGPGGGSEEKPVGTVFIALAGPGGMEVKQYSNPFDRETFKYVTSQQALDMLRRALLRRTP